MGRLLLDGVTARLARTALYASANAWLDALVEWRRAAGLPATAINWGQWADVGLAKSLAFSVLDPMAPAEGLEALEAVLAGNLTKVGVARLRLDRAVDAFPEIPVNSATSPTWPGEVAVEDADEDWRPDALRDLDAGETERLVTARLRKRISAVMGFSADGAIDVDQPLTELGMDSLMAVRMRNTVRADFGWNHRWPSSCKAPPWPTSPWI